MGTLSGGGKEVISIGERCLLGRQRRPRASRSATTASSRPASTSPAGTRVTTPDGEVVKARELSGAHGLLFRRNTQTGAVEVAAAHAARWGGLNAALHAN